MASVTHQTLRCLIMTESFKGYLLKRYRNDLGFSQAQLADELGCTQAKVSHFETNKATPSTGELDTIVRFLELLSKQWLFEEQDVIDDSALGNEDLLGDFSRSPALFKDQETRLWFETLADRYHTWKLISRSDEPEVTSLELEAGATHRSVVPVITKEEFDDESDGELDRGNTWYDVWATGREGHDLVQAGRARVQAIVQTIFAESEEGPLEGLLVKKVERCRRLDPIPWPE